MKPALLRRAVTALALAAASLVVPAAALATPAFAACSPSEFKTYYTFSSPSKTWLPTNLASNFVRGPATVTYSHSGTSTATASVTATVSAEAGVIFAKASASLGVTVSYSYSVSSSWTYSIPVPAGQIKRIRQYKQAERFMVTKHEGQPGHCRFVTAYQSWTAAPIHNGIYLWQLSS